ncbi:MAG: L-threonylcarbamoyladenylate synthase [Pseudomonadota bacterium]
MAKLYYEPQDAAAVLAGGGLLAFGTETVYGLGADARDGGAVARIFAAKGRPQFNPLIIHVFDREEAGRIATFSAAADRLSARFWPGPLTLILPLRPGHGLSPLVSAGLPTVAVRVPAHPGAQALLRAFGGPVAAPSANPSGRISPTRAVHVMASLGDRIDGVLEGGAATVGLESTIVVPGPPPILARAGGVAEVALAAALGQPLGRPEVGAAVTAPGQLLSHYAPAAALRMDANAPRSGEFMIGFGPVAGDITLSKVGDLIEAAATLFDALHTADATRRPIAVAPIPEVGLGQAINDRLRRAAAG